MLEELNSQVRANSTCYLMAPVHVAIDLKQFLHSSSSPTISQMISVLYQTHAVSSLPPAKSKMVHFRGSIDGESLIHALLPTLPGQSRKTGSIEAIQVQHNEIYLA